MARELRPRRPRVRGLDILVSNAGIASASPIDETTLATWQKNLDILATGYFLVAREAFRAAEAPGPRRLDRLRGQQERARGLRGRRRVQHGQGRGAAPRALPGPRRSGARHPRERGQPRRGDPRLADLGRRVARGAARQSNRIAEEEVEDFYRKRSLLKRSVLPGGRGGGRLLLRLRPVREVDGEHPERGRAATWPRSRASGGQAMAFTLSDTLIAEENGKRLPALQEDYEHLGRRLARRGVDIERLTERAAAFRVALPSWGVGTGGTRFARFPGPAEPRNVFEKLEDCEVVFKLVRVTPAISLHIPWDKPDRPAELRAFAEARGLHIDSMNSNTFEDPPESAALLQVRQPLPHRRRRAAAGRRAQPRVPGARAEAGRALPHRLGRGRGELPRPAALPPRPRPLPRQPARDLPARSPTAGACSSSTSSTSPRSTRPCSTTGA